MEEIKIKRKLVEAMGVEPMSITLDGSSTTYLAFIDTHISRQKLTEKICVNYVVLFAYVIKKSTQKVLSIIRESPGTDTQTVKKLNR